MFNWDEHHFDDPDMESMCEPFIEEEAMQRMQSIKDMGGLGA
jgi:hypothetical protein